MGLYLLEPLRNERIMKTYILLMPLVLLCGCVTASNAKPEDASVVAKYSCETLEQKLAANGAMRDRAGGNQNLGSAKEIVGEVLLGGALLGTANHMNAVGNEKKYKSILNVYYSEWDKKDCSRWLYEKNQKSQ
jgi:hypothetical protein